MAQALLVDQSGEPLAAAGPQALRPARDWPPVVVRRATLEAEIDRLAAMPRPPNGRRRTLIVHPSAPNPGRGLNPGVQVALEVLRPGESTQPVRHNSTQVSFCIRGSGHTVIDGRTLAFRQHDVWNHPAWRTYRYVNDGDELQVRLTYSNAALLEMLRIHIVEELPEEDATASDGGERTDARPSIGDQTIDLGGSLLLPYEVLINPPPDSSEAIIWPWAKVQPELDRLVALGPEYRGRRLYLMYNPVTGRYAGTTPNFFATITIRPPNIIDRPHRHASAAINYYFGGRGYSVVEGQRYEWEAGDLMVSAPGWAVHNHASYDEPVYELTIQDHPLNIYMESLLWQEDLAGEVRVLGVEPGFRTNRGAA